MRSSRRAFFQRPIVLLGLASTIAGTSCSSTTAGPPSGGGGALAGSTGQAGDSTGSSGRGGASAAGASTGGAGGALVAGSAGAGASAGSSGSGGGTNVGGVGGSIAGGASGGSNVDTPFPNLGSALVLRLEHDHGVESSEGKVSAWRDQSGKQNDAGQDGASFRPTLKDGYVSFSGKVDPTNGGGDGGPYLRIHDSDSLHWGTGDYAILVVARYGNLLDHTHSGAFGTFFGKEGNDTEILFTGNWTLTQTEERSDLHLGLPGLETERTGFNDMKLRLYEGVRINGHMSIRVNGSEEAGSDGDDDVSLPGVDVAIGSFSATTANRCLLGDIAAVLAVSGDQTSGALAQLESYLKAKYPLAPVPTP